MGEFYQFNLMVDFPFFLAVIKPTPNVAEYVAKYARKQPKKSPDSSTESGLFGQRNRWVGPTWGKCLQLVLQHGHGLANHDIFF